MLLTFVLAFSAYAEDNAPDPERIYNYHQIDSTLATAGQVFPVHMPKLKEQQIGLVVNLAVADRPRNGEESFHVADAGISYVQIPVEWETPTRADLDLFFAVMDARGDRNTLVHCFANFRASAFTYLYRVVRGGVPEAQARKDLMAVWDDALFEQYPQWRRFIDTTLTSTKPHR